MHQVQIKYLFRDLLVRVLGGKTTTNQQNHKIHNKTEASTLVWGFFGGTALIHHNHFCKLILAMPFLLHRKISKSCHLYPHSCTCASSTMDIFALKIRNNPTEQFSPCLVFSKSKAEEGSDGQRNVSAFTVSHPRGEHVHWSSPNVSGNLSITDVRLIC